MLTRVPATGEGISVSTLSVDTSTSGSSTSTLSPTFFSQRVTVPSVTDSPSSGISTGVGLTAIGFGSRFLRRLGSFFRLVRLLLLFGGLLALRGRLLCRLLLLGGLFGGLLRGLRLAAAAGVFTLVTDYGQLAADLDGVVLLRDDLLQHACGGGRNLGVDLVGGNLEQRFVQFDRVTLLLEPPGDGSLGDALTECRHLDGCCHVC